MGMKKGFLGEFPQDATPIEDLSGLKIKEITTRDELNAFEFDACTDATVNYLTGKKKIKEFTRESLFKLHEEMFSSIWNWGGKKRTSNTNIGVNHFEIEDQLSRLFEDLKVWEKGNLDPIDIAVRLHHKLVYIHPFPNGNGRWARLVSNIYLQQKTGNMFRWPEQEVSNQSDFRSQYLSALKDADHLNYTQLLELHQKLLTT